MFARMSAWELGIGVAKGRLSLPLPPLEFFNRFFSPASRRG